MLTKPIEIIKQGYADRRGIFISLPTYFSFLGAYIDEGNVVFKAVKDIERNSLDHYITDTVEFTKIPTSEFESNKYYKLSLRYGPVPPNTEYPLSSIYISFLFKINGDKMTALPDECSFDYYNYENGCTAYLWVDSNDCIFTNGKSLHHNAIIRIEPVNQEYIYYNNAILRQSNLYCHRSETYNKAYIGDISYSNNSKDLSFGCIYFTQSDDKNNWQLEGCLNHGSVPYEKFMPNIFYNVRVENTHANRSTLWRFRIVDNKLQDLSMNGIPKQTNDNSGSISNFGTVSSSSGSYNYFRIHIIREWTPPNISFDINGEETIFTNGCCNIDGEIMDILGVWTRIDDALREV